ncbi:hypothetical protein GF366_01795 [Candidatus Peregrinibacteria bacterium]|nr:hypothetical protein [Candidatus Peregrinibacteria bacterium]
MDPCLQIWYRQLAPLTWSRVRHTVGPDGFVWQEVDWFARYKSVHDGPETQSPSSQPYWQFSISC